jgi:hypothetical protein
MNAEFSGFVARGGHYAPLGGVSYGQGLPSVFGMVALLDRGVKRVHVYVYDLSHGVIAAFSFILRYLTGPFHAEDDVLYRAVSVLPMISAKNFPPRGGSDSQK